MSVGRMLPVFLLSVMNVNSWVVTAYLNSHCDDGTHTYMRVCVCSQSIECLEWLNFRVFSFSSIEIWRKKNRIEGNLDALNSEGRTDDMIWRKHIYFQWQNLIIYNNIDVIDDFYSSLFASKTITMMFDHVTVDTVELNSLL
jgi:hypothetical protein